MLGWKFPQCLNKQTLHRFVSGFAFCAITLDISKEVSFFVVNICWLVFILMLAGTIGKSSIFSYEEQMLEKQMHFQAEG